MFDAMFREASDAALIGAIEEWAAAESAAAARRLAAVAELVSRRCSDEDTADWSCDAWDSAAAEVSAALGVSHGRAAGQMHLAESLRLRLPRIAQLFLAGRVSARVVAAIAWRTNLVTDPDALSLIEGAVAEHATRWDALSQYKLEQAIDAWIDKYDPGALRRTRVSARSRDVTIGAQNHEAGTAALWGRLYASDATLLDRRLDAMAHAVCEDDPRTIGQRRADALGALGAGSQILTCQCGGPECPADGEDARATSVVVHVLADAEAIGAQPDIDVSGPGSSDVSGAPAQPGSAVIVGGGALPTPLLAALIATGAIVRHLRKPSETGESHYRPSVALDEFVRLRDLTCRFPNCDAPAEYCDIDHAVPWPQGPTHPSNLRTLCRKHHLLKTFWAGEDKWRDRQYPDGTIVWTAPSGKTYITKPGSRLLFPAWDISTRAAPMNEHVSLRDNRATMMPKRRRTRVADRAYRITCERALNDARVAERNKPPPF
jgi:phage tail protein X